MKLIRAALLSPVFVAGFAPALFIWALTAIATVHYYA